MRRHWVSWFVAACCTAALATAQLVTPSAPPSRALGALAVAGSVETGVVNSCPSDCAGADRFVAIQDLLALLAQWGGAGACDSDGSGAIDIVDLLALLAAWGPCPCGGGAGTCFLDNGTPGCLSTDCCSQVCAAAPQCCDVAWDQSCADMALQLCADAECPGAGFCFQADGGTGCQDPVCCNIVCETDAFCCDVIWDDSCVAQALALCPGDAGCPGSGPCFQANGTIGCDIADCCNVVCEIEPLCCSLVWDDVCATHAQALCLVNPACPGKGSCFQANGTPGCDDAGCCNLICDIEPFCCDVEWDFQCAINALTLCQ